MHLGAHTAMTLPRLTFPTFFFASHSSAHRPTPRPGATEPRDVMRSFRLINAPGTRARFGDVVGLALRFEASPPGMANEMEWSGIDWNAERWTIPAAKTGWDHVVPI